MASEEGFSWGKIEEEARRAEAFFTVPGAWPPSSPSSSFDEDEEEGGESSGDLKEIKHMVEVDCSDDRAWEKYLDSFTGIPPKYFPYSSLFRPMRRHLLPKKREDPPAKKKLRIIFVGPPGVGKSTFLLSEPTLGGHLGMEQSEEMGARSMVVPPGSSVSRTLRAQAGIMSVCMTQLVNSGGVALLERSVLDAVLIFQHHIARRDKWLRERSSDLDHFRYLCLINLMELFSEEYEVHFVYLKNDDEKELSEHSGLDPGWLHTLSAAHDAVYTPDCHNHTVNLTGVSKEHARALVSSVLIRILREFDAGLE